MNALVERLAYKRYSEERFPQLSAPFDVVMGKLGVTSAALTETVSQAVRDGRVEVWRRLKLGTFLCLTPHEAEQRDIESYDSGARTDDGKASVRSVWRHRRIVREDPPPGRKHKRKRVPLVVRHVVRPDLEKHDMLHQEQCRAMPDAVSQVLRSENIASIRADYEDATREECALMGIRPHMFFGTATPWNSTPHAVCPDCRGVAMAPLTYCLRCDRGGDDAILGWTGPPPIEVARKWAEMDKAKRGKVKKA